jgi:hypothetical protein
VKDEAMCEPSNGKNTPEDVEREAVELEEKNGMTDRRKPHFAGVNGGTKLLLTFIAGGLLTFGLPRLWELGREGGSIEQYMEHDEEEMADIKELLNRHDARLYAVEAEATEGGRRTGRDQLRHEAKQEMRDAQQDNALDDHSRECAAKTDMSITIGRSNSEKLDELIERIVRMEATH